MRTILAFILSVCLLGAAHAQELRALARIDPGGSAITDAGQGLEVVLSLSQPVPFRIRLAESPNRLIISFREVVFDGSETALDQAQTVTGLATTTPEPGWSALSLTLSQPQELVSADMDVDQIAGTGRLVLKTMAISQDAFSANLRAAEPQLSDPAAIIAPRDPNRPLIVVLDPGHGGVDPGAQADGLTEADLMLGFARELREILIREAGFDVLMTRDDDNFVSLPARVSIARAADADVFMSLHADALAEGRAVGTTIYTLSDEASDAASAALAERQDRTDILAGVDLSAQDDQIATVLMDLARSRTEPRTRHLAETMVASLIDNGIELYKRPLLSAGFSVLKAPDIPSILIEVGFLSSATDFARLRDAAWRTKFARAVVEALQVWALEDAARQQQASR